MHRSQSSARFRASALLGRLDLHALLGSPALITSPCLLTVLTTLALLPVLAAGAVARPLSPLAWRVQRAHRAGAMGAGLTAGSAQRAASQDPLILLPATHLALDLRLARLRQSKTLAPLLTHLDARLTKTLEPYGAALLGCAPGLSGSLDRLIVSAPLPGLGSTRTQRSVGAQTTPGSPEAPILVLEGRFDALALARCLAARPGAGGRSGGPTAVTLGRGTLALSKNPTGQGRSRGMGASAAPGASTRRGRAPTLPTDTDTVLVLQAPLLALGSLRIPALEELKDVRSAEALVGLPSDHLELRVALTLVSSASASALALKLQQALTLAAFAVPTNFGLTQALHSAKIQAQGLTVHLRLLLPPGDVQRLLAKLTPGTGLLGSTALSPAPRRRLPAR